MGLMSGSGLFGQFGDTGRNQAQSRRDDPAGGFGITTRNGVEKGAVAFRHGGPFVPQFLTHAELHLAGDHLVATGQPAASAAFDESALKRDLGGNSRDLLASVRGGIGLVQDGERLGRNSLRPGQLGGGGGFNDAF
jgi:hypothetical protein